MFPRAFRAMEMRPASLEGHCPTGKRPGLIGMSGAMAFQNMERLRALSWEAPLKAKSCWGVSGNGFNVLSQNLTNISVDD